MSDIDIGHIRSAVAAETSRKPPRGHQMVWKLDRIRFVADAPVWLTELCDEVERLRAEKGQHPDVISVRDYHAALTDTRKDLAICDDERDRLRQIMLRQGEAIAHQRNRNHNVEKSRSKWRKRAETAERENQRLWNGIHETTYYIEQAVADVFPEQFPLYPADWNAGDDRCVGEHVPESLVLLACNEIRRLRVELKECYRGD